MQPDEKIQAHLVSVWKESKRFFSISGKEAMLILTDKHLIFVYKTKAKMSWWKAITKRQVVHFIKSKNTMIRHDGYNEEELLHDLEEEKNLELKFDDIIDIRHEEKDWGSVLQLEYEKKGKREKFQLQIVQDWVKYPTKAPTKYMKVDWEPFVQYIKDRQRLTK